jgi:small GTP-binding protein
MPEKLLIKRKIVLIGDAAVGKTSLVRKYVYDQFSDNYIMTVGFKVTSKKLIYPNVNNGTETELNLMIWDVMGQKGYRLIPRTAAYGAKGAILVCDLTRRETLFNLTNLTSMLFEITQPIPIVFIANKNDLTGQFEFGEKAIADISTAYHAPYFITSAKTGENVQNVFELLGKMILKEQKIAIS